MYVAIVYEFNCSCNVLSKGQVASFIIVCMAEQLTAYTWGRGKGLVIQKYFPLLV